MREVWNNSLLNWTQQSISSYDIGNIIKIEYPYKFGYYEDRYVIITERNKFFLKTWHHSMHDRREVLKFIGVNP